MQKAPQNHLLGLLPDSELDELLPLLEPIALTFRDLVYGLNAPIEHAYFPESGVVSLVGVTKEGNAVEVATVGNEGMIGIPLFLGAETMLGQAFSQVPGAAFRIKAKPFRELAMRGKFHEILNLYTQALFTQVAQSAACNRLHLTEERFARWLLMTHDRVGRDEFPLTQDFLSQMLGVRRATVSQIASRFQNAGLISYSRGIMTVLERDKIEQEGCECYGVIRAEFERLLGRPRTNPRLYTRIEIPAHAKDGLSTVSDGTPREERREVRRRTGRPQANGPRDE
jgi:CRP-like cAMP-binding protein